MPCAFGTRPLKFQQVSATEYDTEQMWFMYIFALSPFSKHSPDFPLSPRLSGCKPQRNENSRVCNCNTFQSGIRVVEINDSYQLDTNAYTMFFNVCCNKFDIYSSVHIYRFMLLVTMSIANDKLLCMRIFQHKLCNTKFLQVSHDDITLDLTQCESAQ